MPIVIRELIIRTIITDGEERGGDGTENRDQASGPRSTADVAGWVEECVTQVMERLREQNER